MVVAVVQKVVVAAQFERRLIAVFRAYHLANVTI